MIFRVSLTRLVSQPRFIKIVKVYLRFFIICFRKLVKTNTISYFHELSFKFWGTFLNKSFKTLITRVWNWIIEKKTFGSHFADFRYAIPTTNFKWKLQTRNINLEQNNLNRIFSHVLTRFFTLPTCKIKKIK